MDSQGKVNNSNTKNNNHIQYRDWMKVKHDGDKKRKRKTLITTIIVEFCIVICIITTTLLGGFGNDENVKGMIITFTIFIFLILASSNYSLWRTIEDDDEIRKKEEALVQQIEYSETLETLYNEMRVFKHDYVNVLSAMMGYMDEDDMEGLKKFFNENIITLNSKINKSKIGMLQNLKIKEIKGLIASKLINAEGKGININIELRDEIDFINLDKIALTRIIGILLDNAIEATIEAEEKNINFAIVKNNNSITIVISNTFKDSNIPIHKMYKKGFSTKGANRGIGLNNVREILKESQNINMDTFIDKGYFNQVIDIYQKNS